MIVSVIVSTGGLPYTQDRILRTFQLVFLAPDVGELCTLVTPTGPSHEAVLFEINRKMCPSRADVPIGSLLLVVSVRDAGVAECLWEGSLVRLPRRWLRRVGHDEG